MRKNKASNKYLLKATILTIGVSTTIGAMAIGARGGGISSYMQNYAGGPVEPSVVGQITQQAQNVLNKGAEGINEVINSLGTNTGTTGAASNSPTFSSGVSAAASGSVATTAVVPEYSADQLRNAGCDAAIWAKMVSDYQVKAAQIAAVETEQLTRQIVKATPPISNMANCFDQITGIINSATAVYTTITKLLSGGGLDSNQLLQYGKGLLTKYACSLVDSYIGSTGIAGQINSIGNIPNQVLGQNVGVGGINTNVGQILQGGGYQQGQGTQINQVNSGQLANAVGNIVPGFK